MDDALRAILEIHARSTYRAGERPNGRCAFCEDRSHTPGATPLRRFRGHLNGSKAKVWQHEHPDPAPECVGCYYEAAWPCLTAQRAARGLGIELTL